jgi:hypothetical protein
MWCGKKGPSTRPYPVNEERVISKIEGPGSIRSPQPVKRTTKSGGASGPDFSKHLDETGEASATANVSGANAVVGVFGVQEVDDALAHASKGKMRAQDILDRLDDLRIGILTGTISRSKLQYLAQVISSRRGDITDPRLGEVLDEIDLRAQVELAKYGPN